MFETAEFAHHFVILPAKTMHYCNFLFISVFFDKVFHYSRGIDLDWLYVD